MNQAKQASQLAQLQRQMQAVNPQVKSTLLKIYRIIKVWAAQEAGYGDTPKLPGYRYVLQQGISMEKPLYNNKGQQAGTDTARVWKVIAEGDLEWAKVNAEHYKIDIPTDEYIMEDYQTEGSDPVPEEK